MSLLKQDKDKDRKFYQQMSLLAVIPALIIVSPMIGFFIGDYLDDRFETSPYLVIAGLIVGFAAAGIETARMIKKSGVMKDKIDKDEN